MKSKCLDPIYMDSLQRQVYGGKVAGYSLVKTYWQHILSLAQQYPLPVVRRPEQASELTGELVKTLMRGLNPQFLIQ